MGGEPVPRQQGKQEGHLVYRDKKLTLHNGPLPTWKGAVLQRFSRGRCALFRFLLSDAENMIIFIFVPLLSPKLKCSGQTISGSREDEPHIVCSPIEPDYSLSRMPFCIFHFPVGGWIQRSWTDRIRDNPSHLLILLFRGKP